MHNNFYDYSITNFKSSSEKVEIICPVHGVIEQLAQHHLRGHGCRSCRDDAKRKTTTQFLKEARAVQGFRYDYSLVDYKLANRKIEIICALHGVFKQTAGGHLQGYGCPDCSGLKRKTTEEFVRLARAKHGTQYDYYKCEYENSYTKIVIICPEHGPFEQTPNAHLNGYGCQKCGRKRISQSLKKTTDWFVHRAKTVHGHKYDYSLVDYKNTKTKVRIICPDHGEFIQAPEIHLGGHGCSFCAGLIKNTEIFIEDAKRVHGEKYDYSLVQYQGSASEVTILCKRHGKFEAKPTKHLQGVECPDCSAAAQRYKQLKFKNTEEYIGAAQKVHRDKYDYSKTMYRDMKTKVRIICPDHGVFEQNASNHLRGIGCSACSGFRRKTTEEYVKSAKKRHGDYYGYSLVQYKNAHTPVIIICPEHGITEQRARDHLKRKPLCCTETGFDLNKPAIFYYLKINREGRGPLYKVGVTNKSLVARYNVADLQKIELVDSVEFDRGEDAYALEQLYLRDFKQYAYKGAKILSSGNTELFIRDVLQLDSSAVAGR